MDGLAVEKVDMKLLKRSARPKMNYTEYTVKANERHNLTFPTRSQARQYKRLLSSSKSKIEAVIVKRVYADGYIASEEKIS